MYEFFTDGAVSNNGKENSIGSWGFICVENEKIIDKFTEKMNTVTNQYCELMGILSACKYIEKNNLYPNCINTDSAYCYNAWNDKWYINWEKNDWNTSKNTPVKNKDIWLQLLPYFKNPNFYFNKIKGHSNNKYNNIIDELVVSTRSSRTDYLVGQTFGKLKVRQLWETTKQSNSRCITWLCDCECGNTKVVSSTNLKSGNTKSCGCLLIGSHIKDLKGKTFGSLLVKEYKGLSTDNYAIWECECLLCGSKKDIKSRFLLNGISTSCGCIKSKGEYFISNFLSKNNIVFQREYSFNDLRGVLPLRFDFAIFKENKLCCLIEYQGKQHFETNESGWNTTEKLLKTQEYDKLKANYCIQKNIKLYYINYTDNIEESLVSILKE